MRALPLQSSRELKPLFSCATALLLLLAIGPASAREVTDSTGRVVTVPDAPRHVLSLCTTATDTLLRLGAGDRIAGIDEYSRIVPGATNLPVLGKGGALSREQVLARQTDLAFVWWYQDDAVRLLSDLRVPVVKLRCGRADEVPATLRLIGLSVGLTNSATALAGRVATQLDALRQAPATNRPRVFIELYSPFKTAGRDSFLHDLIELAGGRNVAADATGSVLFSSEQLLAADPQWVILLSGFGTPEQFARRGGLVGLSAVTGRHILVLDRYHLVAGAGLPDGVAALRRLIHPEPASTPRP